MEKFYDKIPCRESQLLELTNLLGGEDEPLPYSVFLSGNTATGKSLCSKTVIRFFGYKHVIIDCIECYSIKILCEMILNGLTSNNYQELLTHKCESFRDLITGLNILQTIYKHFEPIVIVFDKAERLQELDPKLMRKLMRLREFCDLNICAIFVTHLIYENFNFSEGLREPIKIYFPNYNKEELFRIIFLNQAVFVKHVLNNQNVTESISEDLHKPELFGNFLNAFLSVFYRPCRDLNELKHMALVNFTKYCEPIINEQIPSGDLQKLWKHIAPILRTSLELLYLRINTNTTKKSVTQSPGKENNATSSLSKDFNLENTLKEELSSTKTYAQSFELPFYTKFLLIAAYLASYNPPKEDKRLFVKNHGKQRKRLQQVKAKAKITEKLNTQLGPKIFTVDRLLAIFYAILEEKISLTSNLLSQIATLVDLKLITGSKELDLDSAKYKCIVSYDFIAAVSQTVGFNIRKYLYDFL